MNDVTLLTALVGAVGALLGTGAAYLACRAFYGRRLGDVGTRLDKVERARAQTHDMLVQAKKQIEGLQQTLEETRRAAREKTKPEAPREPASPAAEDKARAIAETRAKLDRMLDAPASTLGQGGFVDSGMARGFADTQPFSGFGPTQPRAS